MVKDDLTATNANVRKVPEADKVTQSLDLGEVPREESIRCDSLVTWRTLFWWVESGSENCHSKRLESVGNREG